MEPLLFQASKQKLSQISQICFSSLLSKKQNTTKLIKFKFGDKGKSIFLFNLNENHFFFGRKKVDSFFTFVWTRATIPNFEMPIIMALSNTSIVYGQDVERTQLKKGLFISSNRYPNQLKFNQGRKSRRFHFSYFVFFG